MKVINNDSIVIVAISLIFLCLCLPYLNIPGLDSDEACDGLFTYYMFEYHPEIENFQYPAFFKRIGNRFFPIMFNPYVDAMQSYLLLPFFGLFGMSILSLRLLPIVFAILALIFIYLTCKVWFDRRVAFWTVCLTLTSPVYIHLARQGLMNEEIFSLAYFWIALFLLTKYKIHRKSPYLFAGCYFLGLGLSHKVIFIWYILGLFAAGICLWADMLKALPRRARDYFFSFLSLCAGSFFILFFNLSTKGQTLKHIFSTIFLGRNNLLNVDRLAYFENLRFRAIQFCDGILRGDFTWGFPFLKPNFVPLNNLLPFIFFVGLFFLLLIPGGSIKFSKKRIIFFVIVYFFVFLCSPFTLSILAINHLLVMFAFPQLIVSLLLVYLLTLNIRRKLIKVVTSVSVYLILVLALALNINLTGWYYWQGVKKGEVWGSGAAIYELADYLASENLGGPIICLQGGLHHNIPFLTHGKIFVFNREGVSDVKFKELMESYLANRKEFYVIGSNDIGIPGRMKYQEFIELADVHKRECRIIKIFYSPSSGAPKYYLLRVFPAKES